MANQGNVTPFRLLGPVEVVVDGSPIAFGRPQHRDLLVLLLLNANRLLTLDEVIEAMWGGVAPSTALAQVRNMASAVRAVVSRTGLAMLDGRGGYRLRVDEKHIDLAIFEDLVRRGRATKNTDLLRKAQHLWRGQPLAGVRAAYAGAARARVEEERLAAVEDLFDAELARGRHADIVAELTAEVRTHPLAERLMAQLMTALYRCGRQAEALRAYRQLRERLVDGHGLEPGPQLRELEMLILRGDRALAWQGLPVPRTVPAMLPRAPARLVGRDAQARTLREWLADAGAGPVVVTGMAGVGKTALALHAAHAVAERFPDGQLFVDLRGFDPRDQPLTAYEALGRLLTALGVAPDALPVSLDERSGHYRSLLAGTRTLVVLDDARSSAQVRPLIPGSEESAVLVTSRNRLDGLTVTADGRVLAVDALPAVDGRALLSGLIGPSRAEREPAAVDVLAARCGQLPLALCIAAVRLRAVPGQAIGSVVTSFDPIELCVADDASVRAEFDASLRAVPDSNARAFALLGLHPGHTFTLHAAAALVGEDLPVTRLLLDRLAQDHLIVDLGDGQYRMHDLLAEYARRRAPEAAADRDAAIRRMLAFYVAAMLAADRIIHPARSLVPIGPRHRGTLPRFADRGDVAGARSWLDEHYPTLLSLMRLAEGIGSHDHVWQLRMFQEVLARHQRHESFLRAREVAALLDRTATAPRGTSTTVTA